MANIHVNIPDELHQKLKVYKALNNFNTLQESLIDALKLILAFDSDVLFEAMKIKDKKMGDAPKN